MADTGQLLIEIKETVGPSSQQILAYGPSYDPGCKSSVIQVTNGQIMADVLTLDIVFDYVNNAQITPDPATEDCFVQVSKRLDISSTTTV